MKKVSIIIGLLGFFTISCATTPANTDQRKVSAINDQNTVAFNWKFWEKTKEEEIDEDIIKCMSRSPCVYKVAFKECSENPQKDWKKYLEGLTGLTDYDFCVDTLLCKGGEARQIPELCG